MDSKGLAVGVFAILRHECYATYLEWIADISKDVLILAQCDRLEDTGGVFGQFPREVAYWTVLGDSLLAS